MKSLVSSEFTTFCQGQLQLLAQSTGASLGVVYIAAEWLGGENSNWIPVAIYPENSTAASPGIGLLAPALESANVDSWGEQARDVAMELSELEVPGISLTAANLDLSSVDTIAPELSENKSPGGRAGAGGVGRFLSARLRRWQQAREKGSREELSAAKVDLESEWEMDSGESRAGLPHQAMQPLLFDGQPVGMLVAVRERQDWQSGDYGQLENIAQTLSTACVMERRLQWLQTRVHQQEIAQEKQQDIIDNLLHQFRNPLTALRTFGKLLVRRLSPEDRNQAVAAGIVRESDRLQGLLSQIGETVDSFALPEAVMGEIVTEPSSQDRPRLLPGQADGGEGAGEAAVSTAAQIEPLALPAARGEVGEEVVSPLTGKPLVLAAHRLVDLIEDRWPSWEAIAQVRDQRVVTRLDATLPQVWVDGGALGEVLSNLVDNGLKYGSEGGTVAIAVRSFPVGFRPVGVVSDRLGEPGAQDKLEWADDAVASTGSVMQGEVRRDDVEQGVSAADAEEYAWQCIAISDDGPGIPAADLPRLFERHYRGVQAAGAKPGTGLGLAIAKALVSQMGGHLCAQSPAGPFHPKIAFELETALDPSCSPGSAFLIWLKVADVR